MRLFNMGEHYDAQSGGQSGGFWRGVGKTVGYTALAATLIGTGVAGYHVHQNGFQQSMQDLGTAVSNMFSNPTTRSCDLPQVNGAGNRFTYENSVGNLNDTTVPMYQTLWDATSGHPTIMVEVLGTINPPPGSGSNDCIINPGRTIP